METTCAKFLYTKGSSSIFQLFVSEVLLCDSSWSNAVVLLDSPVPLSTLFLDVIWMICLSVALVFMSILGCSSQNITPVDVTLPILWYMYLNKEDIFVITLFFHCFLPSHTYHPSSVGWMTSGRRKSCLMVFGVGGFSSGRCSLAGWCITDSRRSLVSSPTYPAWFSRLTWISWRSITTIFDNSRYSWKTCGQHAGDEPKIKYCRSFNSFVSNLSLRSEDISFFFI